jgi:hypothetical protein
VPTVKTELVPNADHSHSPKLSVQWDESALKLTVGQLVQALRDSSPSIETSDLAQYQPPYKGLGILPHNLLAGEELVVADRVAALLTAAAKNVGV